MKCPVMVSHACAAMDAAVLVAFRSEEHTSELQSQSNLVCRLLLEKKNTRRVVALRLYYHHSRARKVFNLRPVYHDVSISPDLRVIQTTYDRTTSSSNHSLAHYRDI